MVSFSAEDWDHLSQLAGLLVVVDIYPRWAGVSLKKKIDIQLLESPIPTTTSTTPIPTTTTSQKA